MNQTTNLTQWKNLTDEQKAGFDFFNCEFEYEYEHQQSDSTKWVRESSLSMEIDDYVYRLKIEPEKWYFCALDYTNVAGLKLGKDISTKYDTLRPAKPSEIPKPKPEIVTLEDRVKAEYPDFDVAMCSPVVWHGVDFTGFKRGEKHWSTFEAQGMKGFYVYVYIIQSEIDDGEIDFYTSRESTEPYDILEDVKTIHPIAVLFNKGINNER